MAVLFYFLLHSNLPPSIIVSMRKRFYMTTNVIRGLQILTGKIKPSSHDGLIEYLYVFRITRNKNTFYKIGRSRCPHGRLQLLKYEMGDSFKVQIVGTRHGYCEDIRNVESALHFIFDECRERRIFRQHREYFKESKDMDDFCKLFFKQEEISKIPYFAHVYRWLEDIQGLYNCDRVVRQRNSCI
jgi:T5orf172 domain